MSKMWTKKSKMRKIKDFWGSKKSKMNKRQIFQETKKSKIGNCLKIEFKIIENIS